MVFILQNALAIFVVELMFVWDAATFKGSRYSEFLNGLLEKVQTQGFNTAVLFVYSVVGVIVFAFWYKKFYKNHINRISSVPKLSGSFFNNY